MRELSAPPATGGANTTSIAQLAAGASDPQPFACENAAPEIETPVTLTVEVEPFVTVTRCTGERVPIDWPPKSMASGRTARSVPGGPPPPATAGPADAAMPNFIADAP